MRRGQSRLQRAFDEHLAAHDRIDRDVEQQSRQHRGDRRGAFGVRIGQPVVQRRKPDLRPVPDQQKYERQAQHRGLELRLHAVEMRPQQARSTPSAPRTFSAAKYSRIVPNSACAMPTPQRMKYFQPASRLAGVRYKRHEQHGRQRRGFHRHPHQSQVVGRQRDQHRRHEELVHAVVQAQLRRADAAVLGLDTHVRAREERGGQADEGGERHQKHVERVDEELLVHHHQIAVE